MHTADVKFLNSFIGNGTGTVLVLTLLLFCVLKVCNEVFVFIENIKELRLKLANGVNKLDLGFFL